VYNKRLLFGWIISTVLRNTQLHDVTQGTELLHCELTVVRWETLVRGRRHVTRKVYVKLVGNYSDAIGGQTS
jgi:hypothetical protein